VRRDRRNMRTRRQRGPLQATAHADAVDRPARYEKRRAIMRRSSANHQRIVSCCAAASPRPPRSAARARRTREAFDSSRRSFAIVRGPACGFHAHRGRCGQRHPADAGLWIGRQAEDVHSETQAGGAAGIRVGGETRTRPGCPAGGDGSPPARESATREAPSRGRSGTESSSASTATAPSAETSGAPRYGESGTARRRRRLAEIPQSIDSAATRRRGSTRTGERSGQGAIRLHARTTESAVDAGHVGLATFGPRTARRPRRRMGAWKEQPRGGGRGSGADGRLGGTGRAGRAWSCCPAD